VFKFIIGACPFVSAFGERHVPGNDLSVFLGDVSVLQFLFLEMLFLNFLSG